MLGRKVLQLLLKLHIGLITLTFYSEHNACAALSIVRRGGDSRPGYVTSYDDQTISERLGQIDLVHTLPVYEVVLMACITVIGEIRARSPAYRSMQYLPTPVIVVLPTAMLIGTIAVRFRHSGYFGCASGDPYCCGNIVPPNASQTVPGCDASANYPTYIEPYQRTNYCLVPKWYSYEACPGGLKSTPRWSQYYAYGCSATYTAFPYWTGRLYSLIEILFVFICLYIRV